MAVCSRIYGRAAFIAAAGIRFYEEMRDVGDSMWPIWLQRVEDTRLKVAAYLNAPSSSIAFAPTTSFAMNVIAGYLRQREVRSVVTMADSFPAITVSLAHYGFDVKYISSNLDGSVTVDAVRQESVSDVGALVTSSVEYGTGYAHDLMALHEICRVHGYTFVVDASQGLGAFPIDVQVLDPDFIVASTYKWLLGGYGLSVFYIAPRWLDRQPPMAGWMSIADSSDPVIPETRLKATAAVTELGCPNFPAIFALGAAVDFLQALGPGVIEHRVVELTNYLHYRLTESGFTVASTQEATRKSGITAIDVPNSAAVAAQLSDQGIFVSAKGLGLRVSVYIYNTHNDIDRFVQCLQRITG